MYTVHCTVSSMKETWGTFYVFDILFAVKLSEDSPPPELIKFNDTKARCCHLKKLTCKGTLRQKC